MNKTLVRFWLFLSLFLMPIFITAQFFYHKGDTLYVWAKSGLNVRSAPSLKGEKLGRLSYGTALEVLNEPTETTLETTIIPSRNFKQQKMPALTFTGHWAKIKFQDTIGYVYDAYLSRLPAIHIEADKYWKVRAAEDFEEYAERVFGLLETSKKYSQSGETTTGRKVFSSGIIHNHLSSIGFFSTTIIIPDLSFQEGILLFDLLYPSAIGNLQNVEMELSELGIIRYILEKHHLAISIDYSLEISQTHGLLIITFDGGC